MNHDLEKLIADWKQAKAGMNELRTVNIENNKAVEGEYEINLKISVTVTDGAQSEKVSASKKIKTTTQSNASSPHDSDMLLFKESAQALSTEFSTKCGKTYTRLSNGQNERSQFL